MEEDEQDAKKQTNKKLAMMGDFNFNTFRALSMLSASIMMSLCMALTIPENDFLGGPAYSVMYFIYAILFTLQSVFCFIKASFVKRHILFFLYFCFLEMHVFALQLTMQISSQNTFVMPYTISLGFLLIHPILIVDKNVRISVWNMGIALALSLYSVFTQSGVLMVVNLLDSLTFGITGIILGEVIRSYIVKFVYAKINDAENDAKEAKVESDAKSRFLAHMSHEIRTPLNAILGLNELILRNASEEEIRSYASNIKLAGNTLLSLINDVLDFSKITENEFTLIPADYHLDSVINDLVTIIVPRAKEKSLGFNIQIAEDTPNILFGDELRLKQCVLNLLTNAVKYTEKGKITFSISWKKSEHNADSIRLRVSVKDTGIGIKKEDMQNLFTPFERLNESRTRNIEGTGLGMPIVRAILERMGSSLSVASEYGVGSEFSFIVEQKVVDFRPIGNYAERSQNLTQGRVSSYGTFIAPSARILIVDDLKMNLSVILGLLKNTRMQMDTALSGQEALTLVRQNDYDIVFIDHRMPIMDGIETLKQMLRINRETSVEKKTVYIALTANAIQGSREYYLSEGFDDYLSKPVNPEKLEKLILQYLPPKLVSKEEADVQNEPLGESSPSLEENAQSPFINLYKDVENVDIESALSFCAEEEVLLEAVKEFATTGPEQNAKLKSFLSSGDLKNYTITVHALKTALRIVGFSALSERAYELENLGNAGDAEQVQKLNPNFVKEVEQKQNICFNILERLGLAQKPKPEIPVEQYAKAIDAVLECASAGDMASVGDIIAMVENEYEMPSQYEGKFIFLKQAARNGNLSLLMSLANNIKESFVDKGQE